MQELRLVAVSEDGTYLVLATAGRGTRFTLPVDDRLRAAVRGNFSRLGQYEIEVESPLRPKEIQARIRAGETAEEIAATAGIPVERVRWFEGPVLQEREYMAQQAQRCAVRLPGDSAPGPTLGDLVAERLTRRGVPADEIDWDSAKRDDNLWRIKLGFVWNGHNRNAEWIFDPRRRHITPHDDEAMRLSAGEYVEPAEDSIVTPFVPRVAKLTPVPPLAPEPLNQPPVSFPSVVRNEPPAPAKPSPPSHAEPEVPAASARPEPPAAYEQPPMPPIPAGYEAPRSTVPPLRAPDAPGYAPIRAPEPIRAPGLAPAPATARETVWPAEPAAPVAPVAAPRPEAEPESAPAPEPSVLEPTAAEIMSGPVSGSEPVLEPVVVTVAETLPAAEAVPAAEATPDKAGPEPVRERFSPPAEQAEPAAATAAPEVRKPAAVEPAAGPEAAQESSIAVPAARVSTDERPAPAEPVQETARQADKPADRATRDGQADKPVADKPVVDKPAAEPPKPAPAPARPAKKARGRRASVPTWDEIMFGARRQD
ncbi:septation protein SepH [Streptosporangium sp. CA-135522]|uniref:septation protein SepH n=1 Tax=Streptosporangium sp. CA-135522 TaxID=3240072 RepID=UPI003D8B27F4